MNCSPAKKDFRRTKIVATLGPASESEEMLEKLIIAGVNVVRLNFSHGTSEEHKQRAKLVRKLATKHGVVVGILSDMQGPKIRVGKFKGGKITLVKKQEFTFDTRLDPLKETGTAKSVGLTYPKLLQDVKADDMLVLDDGYVEMRVNEVTEHSIKCTVVRGEKLSSNKGVNRQGGGLSADALTAKDKLDIVSASELKSDYIAISFPKTAADIIYARSLVREAGGHAAIIAKIETAEAVDNLQEILDASDAVMVARGDLGIEIDPACVPPVQKLILREAPKYNCPVIVATQMMESMIENPLPTRAEVNDVANAVLDGTDAVMLSAESAAGEFPLEAVQAMHRICLEAERMDIMPSNSTRDPRDPNHHFMKKHCWAPDECIARLAMDAARMMQATAIAAFTDSGSTALYMSRHLARVPIYAFTPRMITQGKVTLFRNVIPKPCRDNYKITDAPLATTDALKIMLDEKLVTENDSVIMSLGTPMGESGSTNTLKIVNVGEHLSPTSN
ncbi:MAG: pyruvate kinase [Mariprofundales bacterium]